jgi:hypothetical protein
MNMTTILEVPIRWRVRLARNGGWIGTVLARSSAEAYDDGYDLAVSLGHDPGTIVVTPECGWAGHPQGGLA